MYKNYYYTKNYNKHQRQIDKFPGKVTGKKMKMLPHYNDWSMIEKNTLYDWHKTIISEKQIWLDHFKFINDSSTALPNPFIVNDIIIPTAMNVTTPAITSQTGVVTYTTINPTVIRTHTPTLAPVFDLSRFPLGSKDACTPEEWALDQVLKLMRSHSLSFRDVAGVLQLHHNVDLPDNYDLPDALTLLPGDYNLPGGAVLKIADDKSYEIDDSNHQTIHKANPNPDFNQYLMVSDVLEKFMTYIASLALSKDQFMELPIRLFILWLIIESAKQDGEPAPQPELKQLELALYPLQPNLARAAVMD